MKSFMKEDNFQLTDPQKAACNDIIRALKRNENFIALRGCAKSGKSTILNHVFMEINSKKSNTIYVECNDYTSNNSFGALQNFLSEKRPKIDVSLSISLSHYVGLSVGLSKKHFNEYHQVKQYISKFVNKGVTNIIIENINNCDSLTLLLLTDLRNKFKNNKNFIVIATIDTDAHLKQEISNFLNDVYNISLRLPTLYEFSEIFKSFLRKKVNSTLNIEVYKLIYKNYKGNLNYLKQIAQAFDDDLIVFNDNDLNDETGLIKSIIINRINNLNKADDLILSLQYGGLIGMQFPVSCIEYFLNDKATEALNEAEHLDLIEVEQSNARFLLNYVKNIFKVTNADDRKRFCADLTEYIKYTFPSRYDWRVIFAEQADKADYVSMLFSLIVIQRLKKFNYFDVNCYNKILCERHISFIDCYINAWNESFKGNYEKSIISLLGVNTCVENELKSERDILLGNCAIKSIDQSYRQIALDYLNGYKSEEDVNNEKDIWRRLCLRKINLLIHCGQYSQANTLVNEFQKLFSFTDDEDNDWNYILNILKRKANSFLSIDIAVTQIKEAVAFFRGEDCKFPLYLKQYYIALNNYAAILGEQSNWAEAFEKTKTIDQLLSDNPTFIFPRQNLFQHNKILISYFSGNINIETAIKEMENYVDHQGACADIIFIKSNLAVLYAINSEFKKAESIINEIKNQHGEDLEGIYDFCVVYNSAIINYLSGHSKEEIIKILSEMKIPEIMDRSYLKKKLACTISLIKDRESYNGKEWLNAILDKTPSFQNDSWKFYGLGYDINLIYDWDDD